MSQDSEAKFARPKNHDFRGNKGERSQAVGSVFLKPQVPLSKTPSIKPILSNTTTQKITKRKSRFSDAPPSNQTPPPTLLKILPSQKLIPDKLNTIAGENGAKSAIMSAAAAAARINANLRAQGKIKSVPQNELTSKSTAPTASIASDCEQPAITEIRQLDDMFNAEVDINDIPVGCRNYLTRLTTQENINKSCLAYVSTRGKFMLPEERKQIEDSGSLEKPLYLFVQSQNKDNVKKALERIKQIVSNHYTKRNKHQGDALALAQANNLGLPKMGVGLQPTAGLNVPVPAPVYQVRPPVPMPHFQPALPSGNFLQEKVFIGLDNIPESFDLKGRILGTNYTNFNFIANQTGAKVILRGRGSGFIEPTSGREAFEAMYAFISHPNQGGVNAAKQLVLNLIETVKQDLTPVMQSSGNNSTSMLSGFNSLGDQYPPSVKNMPMAQSPSPAQVSMYPFQQPALNSQQPNTPKAISALSVTYPPKRKFQEEYSTDDVLGYQHNFAGKSSNFAESHTASSTKSEWKKSKRKKFTEEIPMPPPSDVPRTKTIQKNSMKPADERISDEEADVSQTISTQRKNALPFWMTP